MSTTTAAITLDPTDLESLAEAVRLGITTPEQLADWIGVVLEEDDCLVLDSSPVYADDGNAEVEYDSETSPADAAQEYVDSGDWGEVTKTSWVIVYTYRRGINSSGEFVKIGRASHKIALEATEPDCLDGHDHRWESPIELVGGLRENPGVYGSGGGVEIYEVCGICGCSRRTDTWEPGLTSVSYEAGEFAREVRERHIERGLCALKAEEDDAGRLVCEIAGETRELTDEDELAEFGVALLLNDDATPPSNIGSPIAD